MIETLSVERFEQALAILSAARSNSAVVSLPVLEQMIRRLRMYTWLKYVPHSEVPAYLAAGWTVDHEFSDSHHGKYSKLMVIECEGEPPAVKVLEDAEVAS